MKYLLDTNVIIAALNGTDAGLVGRLASCDDDDLATSAIVYAEVVRGSADKAPLLEVLDEFLKVIPVLPFDAAAARFYASLPFRRARFDRLIAAHALSTGLTIVTRKLRDFADVPGLRIENWMTA